MTAEAPGVRSEGGWFQVGLERSVTAAFVLCVEAGAQFGRVLEANEAMTDLIGYSRDELVAMPITQLGFPEDVGLVERNLFELAANPHRRRIEIWRRVRHADGHEIDVRLDVTPERNDAGDVVIALIQIENLATIQQEERQTRTSEERYRRAFVEAPFPMAWVVTDGPETGRFLGANAAMCALTGYTEAELVAMPPGGLTHPDEAPLDQENFRNLLALSATGVAQRERRIRHADGSSRWARLSFAVQRDELGAIEYGMIHAEDITATKTAEIALRESRERMQRTFENAPIAMLLVDLTAGHVGKIIDANPAAIALFGYPRDVLVGMAMTDLTNPDNKLGSKQLVEDLGVDGEINRHKEQRYRHASGREILGEVSISLVRDADGRPSYGIGQIVDVTEHRATEARLRQSERLESIGQLAGGVAHDVNNLLAGIVNCAGLLAMNIEDLVCSDDAQRAICAEMLNDAREIIDVSFRGAELTRQLLTFSRREHVTPRVLDINAVAEGVRTLLVRTIGENIDLRFELGASPLPVRADKGQLEQVLMNLVVNARDAMPDGGRLLIRTTASDDGSHIVLSVADNGAGMSSEVAAHAFEPFFTTKPPGSNSGLGLATVYGIVTQAGGDVTIDSAPHSGTRVIVQLPKALDVIDEPDEQPVVGQRIATGETVLLVEDEAAVREPTARLLRRHGFTVVTAADADAGMAIAMKQGVIDVLITDVVLPGRSGKDLAAQLSLERPGTKVVFISGYSHDVISRRGVLEPGVEVVEKPFSGADLVAALWRAIDG